MGPSANSAISSNSCELQSSRSLNVSKSGTFYEKARSRRVRHREVLMSHVDVVKPVALKRSISVSKKKVWDDDDMNSKYEQMAHNRMLKIRQKMNPCQQETYSKLTNHRKNPQQMRPLRGKPRSNSRQQLLESIQKKKEQGALKTRPRTLFPKNATETKLHHSMQRNERSKAGFLTKGKGTARRQTKILSSDRSSEKQYHQSAPSPSFHEIEPSPRKNTESIALIDTVSGEGDKYSTTQRSSTNDASLMKQLLIPPTNKQKICLPISRKASGRRIKCPPPRKDPNETGYFSGNIVAFLPIRRKASSRGIKRPPAAS